MIARFRDKQLLRQVLTTSTAGILIGICWILQVANAGLEAQALLALAAVILCGGPIIYGAMRGLAAREVNVDELVSLAIIAALWIGEYLTAATVSFIMVLGSLLESYTSAKARRAIQSLVDLAPQTARLLSADGEKVIPASELKSGQRVLVKPGEKIPVDGIILDGQASIDQAAVTGEPIPVDASPGCEVYSGTFVHGGALVIETTRVGEDSTLGKIVSLIQDAESYQAAIVRSADAFAKWFTPAVLLLAALIWLVSGDFVRCVSILIVGCPCALVLATPTAIVAALGTAAKQGLMIKGGQFLEAVAEVDAIAFDKTGTLTVGCPKVRKVLSFNGASSEEILLWSAAVEQKSEHPLANAVVEEARQRGLNISPVTSFESSTGLGVSGMVDGTEVRVGRKEFLMTPPEDCRISEEGTLLWVERAKQCVGAIVLDDMLRPSAAAAITELQQMGFRSLHLLSGDRLNAVAPLARSLQIDSYRGELLPHEKVEYLRQLKEKGQKVMYIGDGINDGPALATSYVGVAMGAGASPLALETAPVGILRADVQLVPSLIRLSRRTRRRIQENLIVFAAVFNGLAVLLASMGVLSPIMAALTHNAGSVAVVLNSARLMKIRE